MEPQTPPVTPDLASQSSGPIQPKNCSRKMLRQCKLLVCKTEAGRHTIFFRKEKYYDTYPKQ